MTERGHDPGFAVPLSDEVLGALSFQDYPPPKRIEGVELIPLRKHRAENGSFLEVYRVSNGEIEGAPAGFELRQLSAAYADPFRINAFHIHPKLPQHEIWLVLQGTLLIWLVDCRRESATRSARQRVILSSEEPSLLVIPAGVAHGYQAGPDGALLLYGMNQQFAIEEPNEGRLPWDYFGAELWEENRG